MSVLIKCALINATRVNYSGKCTEELTEKFKNHIKIDNIPELALPTKFMNINR